MFELLSYKKFRDTPSVRFFDITIAESNIRDLVVKMATGNFISTRIKRTICSRSQVVGHFTW
jgi:hypothetical protein